MATRELEVAVRVRDRAAVIDLRGDLNALAETALRDAYVEASSGGTDSVVLNFAGADYINSSGIALIVGLLAQARTHGVEVSACGLSDHYREIFEITRLSDFMTIVDNEDGAVTGAEGRKDA